MCRLHNGAINCCGQGSTSQSPNAGQLNLLDLPIDALLLIFDQYFRHADYYDLLALRQTNWYLRNSVEFCQLRHALKRLEPRPHHTTNHDVLRNRLPCYDCLQLRNPAHHFSLAMKTGNYSFRGRAARSRRCMTCSHIGKSAVVDWSRNAKSEHFFFEEGCWIDCKLCRTTKVCQMRHLGWNGAGHDQPVCDVCYIDQFWPKLSIHEKVELPGSQMRRRASPTWSTS